MARLTHKSTEGTSFFGQQFESLISELKEKLGIPQYQNNNGSDKVNFEFDCETEDGENLFTIYDWKEYRQIDETERIFFHIGAYSKSNAEIALAEIQTLLK